jgi:hypothetical protein
MEKQNMSTMVSILDVLTQNGYTTQFKAGDGILLSLVTNKEYSPEEVRINHFYRFEGESNPDDSSIIYAIETDSGEKGTLIDSYGAYSDQLINAFIKEVESIHK